MELVDGLQKHQRLQKLLEKVERRINEGDPDDAAVNMRKILEYITTQYMKEYAQRLAKEDLFGTIKGLESAGILSRETVSLFHKIRMAGNDSGAHFKEEEGSLKKTQSLYKQLLAYIPSFLEDFPEPSKKKVTDNPFNIDYMSITPLLIDVPDYKKSWDMMNFSQQIRQKIGIQKVNCVTRLTVFLGYLMMRGIFIGIMGNYISIDFN